MEPKGKHQVVWKPSRMYILKGKAKTFHSNSVFLMFLSTFMYKVSQFVFSLHYPLQYGTVSNFCNITTSPNTNVGSSAGPWQKERHDNNNEGERERQQEEEDKREREGRRPQRHQFGSSGQFCRTLLALYVRLADDQRPDLRYALLEDR